MGYSFKQWQTDSRNSVLGSWKNFTNYVKGLWQDYTGVTNTDKQLAAQSQENATTREYNLNLAKQQNEWNIAQWNRENAYNSPAAQRARLEAAGLNADMMYGQGGVQNTSMSSPEMTSGAPATPMDWSALGSRPTVGSAIMQTLAIEQARANIKKTEGEAKNLGMNTDILEKYGLEGAALKNELLREELQKMSAEAMTADLNASLSELKHSFAQKYRSEIVENWLARLDKSTGMSRNELKEDIETLALRIAGVNAENSKLVRMSDFTTDEWRLVFDVVRELLKVF